MQHQDGHSHLLAAPVPNLRAYDPAYAYETAVIVQDGIRRMYEAQESIFYYITLYNENQVMPAIPEGVTDAIIRGMYRVSSSEVKGSKVRPQILGSGPLLREALRAQEILAERYRKNAGRYAPPRFKVKSEDPKAVRKAAYQKFMRDFLSTVAGIDDNVGRLLAHLDETGQSRDTVVVYTSDQGYFLGEHNMFDKRFMLEESLRMPFVVRYPGEIRPGTVLSDIILNVDFAELFLDYAGADVPETMQGRSFRQNLLGETPDDWRDAMYYHYWSHQPQRPSHYGIRTQRYKLIYYYGLVRMGKRPDECWELYDLRDDPHERINIYDLPEHKDTTFLWI